MAEAAPRLTDPQILPDPAERWGDSFMAIIAVASPAAQSGKTTLAAHLAVQATRLGDGPVALVDATAGGTLSEWAAKRRKPSPRSMRSDLGRLREDLRKLQNERKHALAIVDIETSDSLLIRSALSAAHLVVIPCPLTEPALEAATIMAEDVQYMGAAAVVAVNGVRVGEDFWNPATFRLRKRGLLAPVVLHHERVVGGVMAGGQTVIEVPEDSLLADDVERLWAVLRRVVADALSHPVSKQRRERQRRLRQMRVIAVASVDGADRRAALAAHLAVQAARSGIGDKKVLLASTEDDGLEQWARMRGEASPTSKIVPSGKAGSLLEWAGESGFELCVMACRLGRDLTRAEILDRFDMLVAPVGAGDSDLARTLALAAELHGLPVAFTLFHQSSELRAALAVSRQIVEGGGRIAGRLLETDDFAHAVASGGTVMERRPESRAARDIVELWAALRRSLFRA